MKRNHDDDLPAQLSDTELERNTERATDPARPSGETGSDLQFAEPWSSPRSDERNEAELSAHFRAPVSPKRNKLSRRLLAAVALSVLIIGGGFALFNNFGSRSVKVNVKTKQPSQVQDATARPDKAPDDVTAEAISEVRSAISNPPAGATSSSSVASVPGGSQNVTEPLSTTVLPPEASASDKAADTKQHERSTPEVSKRNREQSIRFASDDSKSSMREVGLTSPKTEATSDRPNKASSNSPTGGLETARSESRFVANVSRGLSTKPAVARVVLPSFGSILPVRTLGKIYTLRSGSTIRLELTRYVSGEGWSLSKGTVLIGQVRGSERDRAFIAITGFIDPARDRFVTIAGETLGDDGGSGIRGKFHKLSSSWSRAFARVGSAAVSVAGAVAGSRISGQPVIITDVGSRTISPFSYEVDSSLLNQARGFVEVAAGTPGFVMVTTLPADVKGVDAEPDHLAQSSTITAATADAKEPGVLTQEELAVLLTSGDTTRIREALPRMSPQMRRVAESLLAESSEKQSNRE